MVYGCMALRYENLSAGFGIPELGVQALGPPLHAVIVHMPTNPMVQLQQLQVVGVTVSVFMVHSVLQDMCQ